MYTIGLPELIVVLGIVLGSLVVVWPASRICQRAGFSGWLGVLTIVPIVNVVLLWFLAFAKWPANASGADA